MTRNKIPSNILDELLFKTDMRCCICGRQAEIQVHHIDENPSNNKIDNLVTLCVLCHANVTAIPGFGRKWTPSLIKTYRRNHVSDITIFREHKTSLENTINDLSSQTQVDTEHFNLGVVYEENFSQFYNYCYNLEKVLRASTYKELRALWNSKKGIEYLISNSMLIQKSKQVKRLFFFDYSEKMESYLPIILEALKQEMIGLDVRLYLRESYVSDYKMPWDMFGVHDKRYVSIYRVENESIFGGVIPFENKAAEMIDAYDSIFAHGTKPIEFCEIHKIYPTIEQIQIIEAQTKDIKSMAKKRLIDIYSKER